DWVHTAPALAERGPAAIDLFIELGDHEAATELAERVAAERPTAVEPRLVLARLFLQAGQDGRADLQLDQPPLAPLDRPSAMTKAADLYDQMGRHRKACVLRARALVYSDEPALRERVSACQRDLERQVAGGMMRPATGASP